jgi:hypothetical protein
MVLASINAWVKEKIRQMSSVGREGIFAERAAATMLVERGLVSFIVFMVSGKRWDQ